MISIVWKGRLRRDIPYFAAVYRQSGDRGEFTNLGARILAKRKGDSATFLFTEKVNGNSAYRYFIRPADLLDNPGAFNSDTASLVAANFNRLPLVSQLRAVDTLSGILLSWQPLAVNPLITGIEIQRSRDPRGDYVIIDTVSALSHVYMDKRLLPHIAYYYRVCVLHAGKQLQSERFYTSVSTEEQKTSHIPDAYGIRLQTGPKGVQVSWQPVSDPDLYAYFVYRGTSLAAKMQVISPALTDTSFTDTASNLSSRANYVYSVKAVSNANKESVFPEKWPRIWPGRGETPDARRHKPDPRQSTAHQWEDTKRNDPGTLGYILYKCKAGQHAAIRCRQTGVRRGYASGSAIGSRQGDHGSLLPEDSVARNKDKYEYGLLYRRFWGGERGLSPLGHFPSCSACNRQGGRYRSSPFGKRRVSLVNRRSGRGERFCDLSPRYNRKQRPEDRFGSRCGQSIYG